MFETSLDANLTKNSMLDHYTSLTKPVVAIIIE
jgi:hypothetical protein